MKFEDLAKKAFIYCISFMFIAFLFCLCVVVYYDAKTTYQRYVKGRQEVVLNKQEMEIRSLQIEKMSLSNDSLKKAIDKSFDKL